MTSETCPDCGVEPGQIHEAGCDVALCPRCGGQKIGCNCVYEVTGIDVLNLQENDPDMFFSGPTEAMFAEWDNTWGKREIPWTGQWPGKAECREFGWFCHMTPEGWKSCPADHPKATEDLNRLQEDAVWDADRQRYVLPQS